MLSLVEILFSINYLHFKLEYSNNGPVAQRIRHLTTNQGIAGSSPARVKILINLISKRGESLTRFIYLSWKEGFIGNRIVSIPLKLKKGRADFLKETTPYKYSND